MTELVVNTAHLQQLAAQHDTLAREIAAATRVTHGIGQDVLIRHGVSSGFSNHAVAQAQVARHAAGTALHTAVSDLADNLNTAATAYDTTDHHKAHHLNHQLH
ncbi:ESX-1 secretion-associated protein EspC [Mycobacterium pseudokansasii]|uniref:ESX-1 secretion-associated protein EspC n=2 Tax=Mycobacterium pseudokansasii TaxID=2341080 RepID=A0A498QX57_9MYCO|nr:ESX-1 secretion-associated protein [Mycobacterium pseudokansasii]VBA30474.1 ESX-1 secretion-associated protein EspC [Mycobacterium pseudokansasii]VBA32242.1 ESX-1 secretion-associated protein EspC [Mycobacterium pseudokansasii]VBA54430.1 ESX-1 secretion-associated protein EspC [Mycobacterium pseudokansasii]